MKFSIIVPCYNVEDYLEECVCSILTQDFSDFELLLVDDGSKDSTGDKCDQWQAKDERVCVFHKENGGLSDARNYGIDHARGDYLVFVDSDDFIAPGSFKELADSTYDGPEVVITRLIEYYDAEKYYTRDIDIRERLSERPTKSDAILWIMKGSQNTWPAQKYIVSREMVMRKSLRFKKGILHEDIDWTVRLVIAAEHFAKCEYSWYFHRMRRQGSIGNTIHVKSVVDVLETADDLIFSESSPLQDLPIELRDIVTDRIVSSVFVVVNFYCKLDRDEKKIAKNAIAQHKDLLMLASQRRHRVFVTMMRIFGVSCTLGVLNISSGLLSSKNQGKKG